MDAEARRAKLCHLQECMLPLDGGVFFEVAGWLRLQNSPGEDCGVGVNVWVFHCAAHLSSPHLDAGWELLK
jgi:hypothetical protein